MVIEGADYFVYRIPFANRANPAMTFVNDDGTFDIYLNTLFDDARLARELRHELIHIEHDHFYSNAPIESLEREAKGGAK